mgnify:CR=1 FL=1
MQEKYLLKCVECGVDFFTEGEKEFYKRKGLYMPKRCKECRTKRKQAYEERQRHKEISVYLAKLPFREVDKKELSLLETDLSLFIIGNGFDLMHKVPSSYYDFRDSLGKNNNIRFTLETFVQADNLWGDFESNLAYLDRESMLGTIDMWFDSFDVLDEYDEDFSAADYFAAQEVATDPIYVLMYELPKRFRKWIESLKYNGQIKPLLEAINKDARYINFNYTEFLELIYGINKENILYIHGDRRNKNEQLVLGHGHDVDIIYEQWYQSNKDRKEYQPRINKGKVKYDKNDDPVYLGYFLKDDTMGNWKNQIRYDAINNMVYTIESYYEDSEKKTQEVLDKNKEYFKSLYNIKNIVVIGHSLSDVDIPYFKEILNNNIDKDNLNWYFSAYSVSSLDKIFRFSLEMEINPKNITVFKV